MSYKNDSELVILNRYGKASSDSKAELFETYDRIRDLTVSGPSLGGSGLGKFGSVLVNVARMFGSSAFVPTLGSESINIPGTSYFAPVSGGTGITNGGQAAFGLAPFSQISGFPTGGAAPITGGVSPISQFSALGIGSLGTLGLGFKGLGDIGFPLEEGALGALPSGGSAFSNTGFSRGTITGGAAPLGAATAGAVGTGVAAGAGFGRNWVMPAAGIVSGIGGLLTTLGPFFGPFGIAAAAGGAVANGLAGAVLASYNQISNRILVNADTILTNKVKNLETTVKQLDAQQDIVKKLLKD
ncbi:MAG: hypothetical protein K2X66_05605, partial [Cyanobacteria bacterium]|nr:hypothetical protein [Cyanobacteriota bacterium]